MPFDAGSFYAVAAESVPQVIENLIEI